MFVTRPTPKRVLTVTAGLAVAGAVLGGLAGAITLALVLATAPGPLASDAGILPPPQSMSASEILIHSIPGFSGALIGCIATPLAGWLLLRRVPLGQAFSGLVLGAIMVGLVFIGIHKPILTVGTGFLVSAVLLRVGYRSPN